MWVSKVLSVDMEVEMVALDLDGTLYRDGRMGEGDRQAVLKTVNRGIPVVIATTRLRFSTLQIIDGLPITSFPLICQNGARVLGGGWDAESSLNEWKMVRLKEVVARSVVERADQWGYELSTTFPEKVFWKRREGEELGPHPVSERRMVVERNSDALKEGTPVSLMMHKDRNGMEALLDVEKTCEEYRSDIRVDRHHRGSDCRAITIYDKDVSKGSAIELVCDKVGVNVDNVMAIGDDEVDVDMMKTAGLGVAMDDSPEHVKKEADWVTSTVKEQGVAGALERYIL